MDVKKKIAGSAFGVLALAGIGAGVANAATTTAPPPAASTSSAVDTPTPGDAPDAPGAVNGGNTQQGDQTSPDAPGGAPEAGEQADAPGGSQADAPGGANDNVQQGDQTTPDVPGAPAGN